MKGLLWVNNLLRPVASEGSVVIIASEAAGDVSSDCRSPGRVDIDIDFLN